jgi:hypothetical protein
MNNQKGKSVGFLLVKEKNEAKSLYASVIFVALLLLLLFPNGLSPFFTLG